jgi:hypothetical protein
MPSLLQAQTKPQPADKVTKRETMTSSLVEDSLNEITRVYEEDAISQESSIRIVRKSQTLDPISVSGFKPAKTTSTAIENVV